MYRSLLDANFFCLFFLFREFRNKAWAETALLLLPLRLILAWRQKQMCRLCVGEKLKNKKCAGEKIKLPCVGCLWKLSVPFDLMCLFVSSCPFRYSTVGRFRVAANAQIAEGLLRFNSLKSLNLLEYTNNQSDWRNACYWFPRSRLICRMRLIFEA